MDTKSLIKKVRKIEIKTRRLSIIYSGANIKVHLKEEE